MNQPEYSIPTYPVIVFIVKNGRWITALVVLLILAAGVLLSLQGLGWGAFVGSLVVALLLGGAVASYVDVLRLISDTLMPK